MPGWLTSESIREILNYVAKASESPLGIFSLLILVGGVLAYTWFRDAQVPVRIAMFTVILAGIAAYGFAVSRAMPTPQPAIHVTYSGRVSDARTLTAIPGAKVTLTVSGASPGFTDSSGQYLIQASPSGEPVRVRVEAENYETYEQILPPGPDRHFEDIRLVAKAAPFRMVTQPAGPSAPKPTSLSGSVVDSATDTAIPKATVTLTISGDEPLLRTTDSTGVYKFDKIPSNAVGSLRVTAAGYEPYEAPGVGKDPA
jgi:hypothetical protein